MPPRSTVFNLQCSRLTHSVGYGRSHLLVACRLAVRNLAILVVSYFVAQKLFDFAWKAQLRVFYPSPAAYQVRLYFLVCADRRVMFLFV